MEKKTKVKAAVPMVMPDMPDMPDMPLLPDMMRHLQPLPVPQMNYQDGIIPNFFHNIKMKQMAKSAEAEAAIMRQRRAYVEDGLAMIESIITFSRRLELIFLRMEYEKSIMRHQEFMMAHEQRMTVLIERKAEAEIVQLQLKNILLKGEAQLNEVEFKIKMKEAEDILNGPTEA